MRARNIKATSSSSELITSIEEQLREILRDREIMQEQEKKSLLLTRSLTSEMKRIRYLRK